MKKIVSIDIETLGLNPKTCDIIEFGAAIDDGVTSIDELPQFHCFVLPPSYEIDGEDLCFYRGEPFAMNMNSKIIEKIANRFKEPNNCNFLNPSDVGEEFANWLLNNGFTRNKDGKIKVMAAGKNFANFDMKFLCNLPTFYKHIYFHHRIHDPAQLYFNRQKDDDLPSLDTCLKRAGIDKKVSHNALEDALDVIRVLRFKWEQ